MSQEKPKIELFMHTFLFCSASVILLHLCPPGGFLGGRGTLKYPKVGDSFGWVGFAKSWIHIHTRARAHAPGSAPILLVGLVVDGRASLGKDQHSVRHGCDCVSWSPTNRTTNKFVKLSPTSFLAPALSLPLPLPPSLFLHTGYEGGRPLFWRLTGTEPATYSPSNGCTNH